ncbi:predicted protein [Uncinocarpus reesii 1704]|uniref:Uncharacterized protein n=1 Tax=Uncinocarpus reesii (strain UAMH 1704) TaxID=336963 RepID=C4JRD4_UNCRE|nr:uncharacterized protein UREG_05023 [Uncinocarpus reesii 1704]EEP80181.1 predicted protein [Uncinocarpus reesii 1704]
MLVRHHVVFVLRVHGLKLRVHEDVFDGEEGRGLGGGVGVAGAGAGCRAGGGGGRRRCGGVVVVAVVVDGGGGGVRDCGRIVGGRGVGAVEVFEEVGETGVVEVDVGWRGVFGLGLGLVWI